MDRLEPEQPAGPRPVLPHDLTIADDEAEIKALLGRLPLTRPSAAVDRRVRAELDRSRPAAAARPQYWRRAVLAAAAAAAVAAVVGPALLRPPTRPTNLVDGDRGAGSVLPTRADTGLAPAAGHDDSPAVAGRRGRDPDERTARSPTPLPWHPVGSIDTDHTDSSVAANDAPVRPVNLERTFERVRNDGVVLVEGRTAYTRLHRQAIRRIVVVDPTTGRQVVVTVPTTEVRVRKVEPF